MDPALQICVSPRALQEIQEELEELCRSPECHIPDLEGCRTDRLHETESITSSVPTSQPTPDYTATADTVTADTVIPSEGIKPDRPDERKLSEEFPEGPSETRLVATPTTTRTLFLATKQNLCWRCGRPGHRRDSCQHDPVLFCSGCGKLGVMSKNCVCRRLFPNAYPPINPRHRNREEPVRRKCSKCGCPSQGKCRRR